jgi:hypothetical protein
MQALERGKYKPNKLRLSRDLSPRKFLRERVKVAIFNF